MNGKFKIGDWVEVDCTVTFRYNHDNKIRSSIKREMYRSLHKDRPRIGQIVGARYRNIGVQEEFYGEAPTFKNTKCVLVYQIKSFVLDTPFEALAHNVKYTFKKHPDILPNTPPQDKNRYNEWRCF